MTPLQEASAHLAKAREFLEAADVELAGSLYSASTSSSVLAGINAKDAICLRSVGRTAKADDHRSAVVDLTASGPAGAGLATTFRRLLALKTRSQYTAGPISPADAHRAFAWATRMVDAAAEAAAA